VEESSEMGRTIALISYCFHELVRKLFLWLVARHAKNAIRTRAPLKWRTMSEEFKNPGFLLAVSVLGPRWNCHALLATLSPILVRQTLSIDLVGLGDRFDSWSIVLYDESWTTREWLGSTTTGARAVSWTLPPGSYSLSLRFYTDADDMSVPAVMVDGHNVVAGGIVAGEATKYRRHLESVRNRSGLYYRLLHYYIFFHLKHRTKSADWIRDQFLPMGNPDTEWHYGHLAVGEQLRIRLDAVHQRAYNTYVAFYNWASFPVDWCRVQALEWQSVPSAENVAYAVRCVRRVSARTTHSSDGVFEVHNAQRESTL
jgi:hypothetical protein